MIRDVSAPWKFCPYCMVGHFQRGRACCPKHARRVSSRLSAERAGRERARQLSLAAADERCRSRRRWRDIAFGRDADARLREIFGVDVSEAPSHTSHDPRALAQAAPSGVGQAQPLAGIVTSRDGAGTDIGDRSGERQ